MYSGEDDVVNDTIHELGLGRTIIHLGNVKRSNISFDIQRYDPSEVEGGVEDVKRNLTLKRVREYINRGEKVLTYFPYRSQVDQIYNLNTRLGTLTHHEQSVSKNHQGTNNPTENPVPNS